MEPTVLVDAQLRQPSTPPQSSTCAYQCKICPLQFATDWDLLGHCITASHNGFSCATQGCNASFRSFGKLESHATNLNHKSFGCNTPGCQQSFFDRNSLATHLLHTHVADHHHVEGDTPFTCIECGKNLANRSALQAHANSEQHSPFLCYCGIKFARVDVLYRHIDSYANDTPKFPCALCKFHRGRHGFRRRDHLVQHLRGYHKLDSEEINTISRPQRSAGRLINHPVCPHSRCEFHREASFWALSQREQLDQRPFSKQADLTKHLREVHGETPFPCDVPGCDKVGAKGYVREKDLMKHRSAKHPEADSYVAVKRLNMHTCKIPGCGKVYGSAQGLSDHVFFSHGVWKETRAH